MRRTFVALALMFALGFPSARAAEPLEVNVILSLTGAAAFLGSSEATSVRTIESMVNKHGGLSGRPLKFTVYDDQTTPQIAVQIANQIIAKGAPVIVGPSLNSTCAAITALLARGPVDYCLAPGIRLVPGSFQFSAGVGAYDYDVATIRFLRLKGYTKLAFLTTNDATGQDFDRTIDGVLGLSENKAVTVVDREHYNPTDVSIAAQASRMKAAQPQAILVWTSGTSISTAFRGLHDAGLDLPIAAASSNMNRDQLEQVQAVLPSDLYFPALRGMIPAGTPRGAVRTAQDRYLAAFKDAGLEPDFAALVAWDPTMLVLDGLHALGPAATAESLRAWIAGQQAWAGTNGTYDFKAIEQRGIGVAAATLYRWNPSKRAYDVSSGPGGAPH
jgi:branched-chain amino acid transport system substrate-binding protein